MNRREVIAGFAMALVTTFAHAQQPSRKMWRIGWLGEVPPNPAILRAFVEALHELGYTEGQNLLIKYWFSDGKSERLPFSRQS
jgi:putative tryptophan/tyrosine transport system substrate-binding protein